MEKKIPDTNGLVKKTDCNAKITEIEGQIPSTCGLAANSALTALKLKKKTDKNSLIIIMINILLLQNLICLQQTFLMQD